MEEQSVELVDHKVEIDKYTELTLKIPKVMTALELKALTVKANKIFNLSEVPLVAKRSYRSDSDRVQFTGELDKQIYKHREIGKLAWDEIAKDMKIAENKLQTRMYRLKREGLWSKKLLEG